MKTINKCIACNKKIIIFPVIDGVILIDSRTPNKFKYLCHKCLDEIKNAR